MRQLFPLLLVGLLVIPTASAQQPAPAVVATGSTQNSSSGSATGSAQEPAAPQVAMENQPRPAKPAPARRAKKRKYVKGPVANFPSFRILPDGSTRIDVQISDKVIVAERKAEGRLSYRIKGASVPVKTNLLPLETSFFRTPVGRIMLVEEGAEDVELIVELRQPSEATHRLIETESGVVLQVDFPPPKAQAPQGPPAK